MVVAANFVAVAARMSLVTFLGIYFVREAGIDLGTVGVAFLCESVLRGLAAPVFGAASDRIGRRALLIGAALSTAAILPCFLLVSGPLSLFAWSIALGVTGAVNMPVASALLIDLAPPDRRQSVLALNYTAMSVAYTLGVMPAGYVAERSYLLLAILSAVGYFLVAVLYTLALRAPPRPDRERSESGFMRDTVSTFRDSAFRRFALLAFVFPLSMGLVVTASPIFASDLGLGEGYIGLVLGGNSIIVALLALPVATRIEPMGPYRLLGPAALLVSFAFVSYAMIPGAAAAYLIGTIVFSFGELIFSSAVPAAVANLAPPGRRGAYQGGWALVSSLSMGSALVLSSALRGLGGWQGAWLAYAALLIVATLGLLWTRNRFTGWSATPGKQPDPRVPDRQDGAA
ncbi:MAG: MFS transporter [Pseudomonadota bacterium]|nr:MFS transporter [Pseudomonadota bacterium]